MGTRPLVSAVRNSNVVCMTIFLPFVDTTNGTGRVRHPTRSFFEAALSAPVIVDRRVLKRSAMMLYAVLCYNNEDITGSWTKEEDDMVMARLATVTDRLDKVGKLGPVARLMPTTAATTLRKGGYGKRLEPGPEPSVVTDGPFAETKEQLLGFYVIECVVRLNRAVAVSK